MTSVPHNFIIPDNYQKRFIFGVKDFRYVIEVRDGAIYCGEINDCPQLLKSKVLDFIESSLMEIRADCGAL